MKIYQTYYAEHHRHELVPGLEHLDTRGWDIPLLEYSIFQKLRPQGNFGVVSWAFTRKTFLEDWQDTVHDKLLDYDAVIINPFPAIAAVSVNCWDSHPKLKKFTIVDTQAPMYRMAFCSYIIAKKCWWDKYFGFIDRMLQSIHPDALKKEGYWRNNNLNALPFLIERWLNYTLDGAWLWEYDIPHHHLKYGHDEFYKLQQDKFSPNWWEKRQNYDFIAVCKADDIPWKTSQHGAISG